MPKPPHSITVCMYNVGFGDCFLLTFHYAKQNRHMLVDYGSTSAPKYAAKDYMKQVAEDIKTRCNGKLHILVATHRHRDHISGFATGGAGTGKIIASLGPDYVIQPWTEDPKAARGARTAASPVYIGGKATGRQLAAQFLASLEDMHRVSAMITRLAENPAFAGRDLRAQLSFLGEDNLKNVSAVKNLIEMGKRGTAYYVNSGMKLNGLLPGVRITVLGPPTLEQTESIHKERDTDANEFWQFRRFWASQRLAAMNAVAGSARTPFPKTKRRSSPDHDPNVRWFVRQSRQINADRMLELVRDLDSVMNNTSVILLLEAGNRKLLFPGDAQIENWSYALSVPAWKKLLRDVNLYKVGHHGSLNATPKSLWALFGHKGGDAKRNRLETLCSTKSGKHGSSKSGTEVPRSLLVKELDKNSRFSSTENYDTKAISKEFTIRITEVKHA